MVTYCFSWYFEEYEARTNSSLVCTLPSLLGRRTCSDHANILFMPYRQNFVLVPLREISLYHANDRIAVIFTSLFLGNKLTMFI